MPRAKRRARPRVKPLAKTRVTIAKVARRAARDKRFYRDFVRSPQAALDKAGLSLSPEDLRAVRRTIRGGRVHIDIEVDRVVRFIEKCPPNWLWRGLPGWPWRP